MRTKIGMPTVFGARETTRVKEAFPGANIDQKTHRTRQNTVHNSVDKLAAQELMGRESKADDRRRKRQASDRMDG
jgi:hypothetical protein